MNTRSIARKLVKVKALTVSLMLAACGDGVETEPAYWSPSGGSEATAGGDTAGTAGTAGTPDPGTGGTEQTGTAGSAGDTLAGSGGTDALAGMGGAQASGGQPGGSAGEAPQAGTGGSSAGAPQGGSGGQAVDPLEPVPAANCPGYVDVLVPKDTCIWFHGEPARSFQNANCDVVNPIASSGCGTVTAVQKDITSRVSVGANYERFAFDATGCPKSCN